MDKGSYYKVKKSEGCWELAIKHGLTLETLWYHKNNADLRTKRNNPNVLEYGDTLFIPDPIRKNVTAGTGEKHRFQRKGVPHSMRLRFLRHGKPRAGNPWTLYVDGREVNAGNTDAEGVAEFLIKPDFRNVVINVGDDFLERYNLNISHLVPVDEVRGVQQRLLNLGYFCRVDGKINDGYIAALQSFQKQHDLEVNGVLDEGTRDKLLDIHAA